MALAQAGNLHGESADRCTNIAQVSRAETQQHRSIVISKSRIMIDERQMVVPQGGLTFHSIRNTPGALRWHLGTI